MAEKQQMGVGGLPSLSGLQSHTCTGARFAAVNPEAVDASQSGAAVVGGEVEPDRVDDARFRSLDVEGLGVALLEVVGELGQDDRLCGTG